MKNMMLSISISLMLAYISLLLSRCSGLFTKTDSTMTSYREIGKASYYAMKYQTRKTASGEIFDHSASTASHNKLSFGTKVKVTNVKNGKSVIVRINDRGPFVGGRIIDLSRSAFSSIGNTSFLHNSKIGLPKGSGRFLERPPWSLICCFLMLWACILLFSGCAATKNILGGPPFSGVWSDHIETNHFLVNKEDDIFGQLGVIKLNDGDTLPDIARHFSLGINAIRAANPGVDLWVPRTGEHIMLPLSFTLPEVRRKGVVINLAAMRLFYFKKDGNMLAVSTFPVGIGTAERPTPMGCMYITRKKLLPNWYVPASIAADHRKKGDPLPAVVPPGQLNPLGEHALYLNKPGYLIHGTNKPASIGLRATNGCIRLYPEDIKWLFDSTLVETPVTIVDQPYLIGLRDDLVYLEAHAPLETSDTAALKKAYAKLNIIQKRTGQVIDWYKVKKIMLEARGIPLLVSAFGPGSKTAVVETISLKHPGRLYGQPQVPEFRTDAWYVLAANFHDKVDAQRLAAIINHQGPQIPARVLSMNRRHRVLAGPFLNKSEANDAAKRMRIDLEIDSILVAPVERKKI